MRPRLLVVLIIAASAALTTILTANRAHQLATDTLRYTSDGVGEAHVDRPNAHFVRLRPVLAAPVAGLTAASWDDPNPTLGKVPGLENKYAVTGDDDGKNGGATWLLKPEWRPLGVLFPPPTPSTARSAARLRFVPETAAPATGGQ